ncbi:hypothetical protein BHE74_00031746 [Ensete ventricosum]|nr:hypothetical protein BHE74_00031746 [Ensete ventricosum]RZR84267.1 hypothetical protein BHM03_00011051 [Ensete ventricosum]
MVHWLGNSDDDPFLLEHNGAERRDCNGIGEKGKSREEAEMYSPQVEGDVDGAGIDAGTMVDGYNKRLEMTMLGIGRRGVEDAIAAVEGSAMVGEATKEATAVEGARLRGL